MWVPTSNATLVTMEKIIIHYSSINVRQVVQYRLRLKTRSLSSVQKNGGNVLYMLTIVTSPPTVNLTLTRYSRKQDRNGLLHFRPTFRSFLPVHHFTQWCQNIMFIASWWWPHNIISLGRPTNPNKRGILKSRLHYISSAYVWFSKLVYDAAATYGLEYATNCCTGKIRI